MHHDNFKQFLYYHDTYRRTYYQLNFLHSISINDLFNSRIFKERIEKSSQLTINKQNSNKYNIDEFLEYYQLLKLNSPESMISFKDFKEA